VPRGAKGVRQGGAKGVHLEVIQMCLQQAVKDVWSKWLAAPSKPMRVCPPPSRTSRWRGKWRRAVCGLA